MKPRLFVEYNPVSSAFRVVDFDQRSPSPPRASGYYKLCLLQNIKNIPAIPKNNSNVSSPVEQIPSSTTSAANSPNLVELSDEDYVHQFQNLESVLGNRHDERQMSPRMTGGFGQARRGLNFLVIFNIYKYKFLATPSPAAFGGFGRSRQDKFSSTSSIPQAVNMTPPISSSNENVSFNKKVSRPPSVDSDFAGPSTGRPRSRNNNNARITPKSRFQQQVYLNFNWNCKKSY